MLQIPKTEELKFAVPYETDIVKMNPFNRWIIDFAQESELVEFFFEHSFESPIIENDSVIGIKIKDKGEFHGKLVIDCTGRFAVVRNSLPNSLGLLPLRARPQRMFTVYMQRWRCNGDFPKGSNTYVCYKGFANQCGEKITLVGASTLLGLEHTKKVREQMIQHHLSDVEHKVLDEFWDEVPYDFPPSNMVANRFMTIGDSAFQNKPFNGEGMSSGMEAARVALPTILRAIMDGKNTREDLWQYNVDYFTGIGAKFALIRGTGETLVDLSPEDFNWMYKSEFLTKKDMLDTWTKYEVKKGIGSILKTFFRGMSNIKLFKKVIAGLLLGFKLNKLYKKYPETPEDLDEWELKFEKLIN